MGKRKWCTRCAFCVECCEAGLICEHIKDNPNIKLEWEEEFEDKIGFARVLPGCSPIRTSLEKKYLCDLVARYLGNKSKVKIKARKGKIVIERIK